MTPGKIYKVQGIILKRHNVGEADRILTVFTKEYGKIRVIAKGVRRISSRRGGHTEIFRQVVLILYRGKSLDVVSEATTVKELPSLGRDLRRVTLAYYVCELVDQLLPQHQEHQDVFVLLGGVLQEIAATSDLTSAREAVLNFAHSLLWSLGFLPKPRRLDWGQLEFFIEGIIERKLRTPTLLTRLQARY